MPSYIPPANPFDELVNVDNKKVEWQFVVKEQPVCLWSMTWKEVKNIITGKDGIWWSIGANSLVNAKVLYYRNKEKLEKFNKVKERVLEGGNNAITQAIENFDSLYGLLWRLQKHLRENNKHELTFLKWNIVTSLNFVISALNNKYFMNNWGKQFREITNFSLLPVEYISRIKKFLIAKPDAVLGIATGLVEDARSLLKEYLKSDNKEYNNNEISSKWSGIIEYLNKSKIAEEQHDLFAGLYAACDISESFIQIFKLIQKENWRRNCFYSVQEGVANLPEEIVFHIRQLLESQDLGELRYSTEQLTEKLEKELSSNGIIIPRAKSLDDGKNFIHVKIL